MFTILWKQNLFDSMRARGYEGDVSTTTTTEPPASTTVPPEPTPDIFVIPDLSQYLLVWFLITLPPVLWWYCVLLYRIFSYVIAFFRRFTANWRSNRHARFVISDDDEEGTGVFESIKPHSPFFPSVWPKSQVMLGTKSPSGEFEFLGCGYRHRDYLVTAYHNIAQDNEYYLGVPGKEEFFLIPVDCECFFDDLAVIPVSTKTWSRLGVSTAKHHTFRMAISVLATHPKFGASSGMLSHSNLPGVVDFSGSTTAGSSGSPYYFGSNVAGLHTTGSTGRGPNTGISASIVEAVIAYLERRAGRETSAWDAIRKQQPTTSFEAGGKYFAQYNNRFYVDDNPFDRYDREDLGAEFDDADGWSEASVDYNQKLVWESMSASQQGIQECLTKLTEKLDRVISPAIQTPPQTTPIVVSPTFEKSELGAGASTSSDESFLGPRSGSTNATSHSDLVLQKLLTRMEESSERLKRLESSMKQSKTTASPLSEAKLKSLRRSIRFSSKPKNGSGTSSSGERKDQQPVKKISSSAGSSS